ncbi:uncharacterized protein LOC131045552 [Cryptomeria japonica]|uniref:uncharacterized protein LOC131045552 n=1 Tax=Cryptomeria japonica TaxID=3369 RepID=UPI0025AC8B26|nr:uncharacterized protein LOC131045552 [Cryptomeria japonica]
MPLPTPAPCDPPQMMDSNSLILNQSLPFSSGQNSIVSQQIQQPSFHSSKLQQKHVTQNRQPLYHQTILQPTTTQQCTTNCFSSVQYIQTLQAFRHRIDLLSMLQTCSICKERYIGMLLRGNQQHIICSRCFSENGVHRFSLANNLDPGKQPVVLKKLTQVEEMLIARVAPVLQVRHGKGGQYKYSGHTISFPQDISEIAKLLPRRLKDLEVLIVHRNFDAVNLLPNSTTDISNMLRSLEEHTDVTGIPPTEDLLDNCNEYDANISSSFIPKLPTPPRELDTVKRTLQLDANTNNNMPWPEINLSPINEYNTIGLLSMAFPTLFPSGVALPLQPCIKHVHLHEYALHLLRYVDQRFGQHVRFRYYIYNLIMRHRSQQSAAIFIRTNLGESIPTTIEALHGRLQNTPDDQLPNQLLRFGATLRGTRAYWRKSRKELTAMIFQLGPPTLFFTLSSADTKWPDLHRLFSENDGQTTQFTRKQLTNHVICNPHITALYLHNRFTIFREEVIQKLFQAKDHWYRYEWQHRGSGHIHGFLWLPGAPNMETINWTDDNEVQMEKTFFDQYVSAWNPHIAADRMNTMHYTAMDDPCLADTKKIFTMDATLDYEALLNTLQRHTKCTEHTCLKKKGPTFECRYKAPWVQQEMSTLTVDNDNNPCYKPTRNDDHLNIHNPWMLSLWRANIDCQPVISKKVVLQYISKYASKSENKSQSYIEMLKTILNTSKSEDSILLTYQKFMMGIVVDRDISAQETCHMLQKLPLLSCSRQFVSLNVGRKILHRVIKSDNGANLSTTYIHAYMQRPFELNATNLLQSAQGFSYNSQRKKTKWHIKDKKAIVTVYPQFTEPPDEDTNQFDIFCLSELLLYKSFRDIPTEIGASKEQIIKNWKNFKKTNYNRLGNQQIIDDCSLPNEDDSDNNGSQHQDDTNLYEWEQLSQMGATNNFVQNDLQMLGRRDYDISHFWGATVVVDQLDSTALQFIATSKLKSQHTSMQISSQDTKKNQLSPQQKVALNIILQHHNNQSATTPLRMIVQGTAGNGKSFLIDCIRKELNISPPMTANPLLVLAPTGVAAFNIQATTIHAGLRIPIREMHPLTGQSLMTLQEQLKHIKYILIDEMSFLGPKLLLKIDNRLRQAFPNKQHDNFGGVSMILVGDLAQLPPIMDKPIYASHSTALSLWHSFTIVITLDTIFRQQGASIRQQQFRALLHNLRNAQALQHDWQFLMCQTNATLTIQQKKDFDSSIHLFATNESARLHNRKMLKELNLPVALSLAKISKQTNTEYDTNEQLPLEVLLSIDQQVMLIANLWIKVGLVNGAIGLIKQIVYENNTKPPDLPKYVVVQFNDYNGPPWDIAHPKDIPILPIM